MAWYSRLRNVLRPERLSSELDREMEFHIAERADELVSAGMSEAEARREARRRFGSYGVHRESARDADVLRWLESVLGDVRYAARALRASPGFALVAILSLGLGIGANTAVFSLLSSVVLRPLPVSQPEALAQVTMGEEGGGTLTNPLWEAVRDRQDVFEGVMAYSNESFDVAEGGAARRIAGNWVSGDFFRTLGVSAAAGRLLERAEDVRGCTGAAVLSHGFWQSEYGGAADAIGKTISLDGRRFPIVGVTEPGFFGADVGRSAQVYAPLCAEALLRGAESGLDNRSHWFLSIIGRLKPGVTMEAARARLAMLAPGIYAATVPEKWIPERQQSYLGRTLSVVEAANGLSEVRLRYRDALLVLMAVVGVVLLIACANVAHLLLARSATRQREMAVRLALGAGRGRLVRQLLTENLLLSLLGAAVGALFARWASELLVGLLSTRGNAVWLDLSLDGRVLAFTIGAAVATGVLFGLAPAWRATRVEPQSAMKANSRGIVEGASRWNLGKALVVGQVALSLVLVVAAGLLLGTFRTLTTLDPGFKREGVLLVSASLEKLQLDLKPRRELERQLLERLRGLPGVLEASASFFTPISGHGWNDMVEADGFAPSDEGDALAYFNGVSDGYFETLGTARIAGRDFDGRDGAGSGRVAAINESMARKFFGQASPLGRQFRSGEGSRMSPPIEVIAVVQDSKYSTLQEAPPPTAYLPIAQAEDLGPRLELALRSDGPLSALVPAVAALAAGLSPDISLDFTTLSEQVESSLTRPRLLAILSGFFGGLALLLAIIGLYGTMSYSVARRRNEIGIRIALGAARTRVLSMVAGEAGRLVAAGVVLGLLLALAGTRLVAAFLFGVQAWDPLTLGGSALILAAVAMLAGLVPAWRAARLDPMAALREE